MTKTSRPSSLLLPMLLLAVALLTSSSPVQAASNSSTNLETIAAISVCTDSQAAEIAAIMASNTNFQDCKADVGSDIFNLTDPLVLCDDTACVAGLQSLYNDLPECRYGSTFAFQYISTSLLRNCGIKPVNETSSSASASRSDSTVTISSSSGSTSAVSIETTATPAASTASSKPSTSSGASSGSPIYQQYFVFALASMALSGFMA